MTDLCDFLGRLDEDPRLPEVLVLMNLLVDVLHAWMDPRIRAVT